MTITARVHNHSVLLPAEVTVAEGAEVQVTLPETATSSREEGPAEQEENRRSELLMMARSLAGSLSLPAGGSDKELITEARLEKHGGF